MVWLILKWTIILYFFFFFDNLIVEGEESKLWTSLLETLGGINTLLKFDNMIE